MPLPFIDLTGQRFGRLVIIKKALEPRKWECQCDCNILKIVDSRNLKNGTTRSCGCLMRELNITHGDSESIEWKTWYHMIDRCMNPNHPDWDNYGGRGIQVCDEWLNDYPTFLAYVGRKPSPEHSIDRYPNNDGNYEPGNIRWATKKEQANNRRSTHK